MSSVRRVLLTIALGTALGAGPAIAAPAMAAPKHRDLAAVMSGQRVVPILPGTKADADGRGLANVRVFSNGRVCYTLFVRNLGTGAEANIYVGGRTSSNLSDDLRVRLDNFDGMFGAGCERINKFVARQMMKTPNWYNVQVNSNSGAIRGQLFRNGNNW